MCYYKKIKASSFNIYYQSIKKDIKTMSSKCKNLKRAREPEDIEMAEATSTDQVVLDILVCSSCN
jgi:hypothetical protein